MACGRWEKYSSMGECVAVVTVGVEELEIQSEPEAGLRVHELIEEGKAEWNLNLA